MYSGASQVSMEKKWLEFISTGKLHSFEILEMMILHLIETEDPKRPYSDMEVSNIFRRRSMHVTRTMVECIRKKNRIRPAEERAEI